MGIPVIEHKMTGGVGAYRKLMRKRWRRAKKIASVLIGRYQVPVTPLPNPVTKRSSFHIVKLTHEKEPGYSVDLLMDDGNGYLVAFRRQRLENAQWSGNKWYRYTDVHDEDLPPEISKHAEDLEFYSSHVQGTYATPGGASIMRHIFKILSTYEDCERSRNGKLLNVQDREKVKDALLRAIVMYCESFRFRSIYLMMLQRACDGKESSALDHTSWKLIRNWDHGCLQLLNMWKTDLPPLHSPAPDWFRGIKLSKPGTREPITIERLSDLIGEEGEMMLINVEVDLLVTASERANLEKPLKKRTSLPIPEPGFN